MRDIEKVADAKVSQMKYSVLMSVYAKDNTEYFIQAVNSMLAQTIPPEQFVLVVDGAVPKELANAIAQYAENEELFTVVRLKENKGLGHALDVGLEHCRNELVARMDADDISLPERCERELEIFDQNKTLAVCGTHMIEFNDSPEKVHTMRKVPTDYVAIKKMMRRRQAFNHPTVMYKKSEVIRCGRYGNLRKKQDYDLFSRMINMGCYALNVDDLLFKYRADENNYKRRKSWSYVKSSIKVGALNYQRKYCSLTDLLYIICGQIGLFIMPVGIMRIVSDKVLREKC